MQLPRSVVDNYTAGINGISEQARAALSDAFERVDFGSDVATVRTQVVEVMQAVCGASVDVASVLSAQFYDEVRLLELGQRLGADPIHRRDPRATEGAIRAFAERLVDGDEDEFMRLCLERVDYEIKVGAANTCINNARRDPRKPRFARVPSGSETCDFCLMLASRGFVYRTEAAASHAHANCDCRVVPSWKGAGVEGYDPEEVKARWNEVVDDMAAQRAERNGTTVDDERRAIMSTYAEAAKRAKERAKASK